jgi:hypothetical protein
VRSLAGRPDAFAKKIAQNVAQTPSFTWKKVGQKFWHPFYLFFFIKNAAP